MLSRLRIGATFSLLGVSALLAADPALLTPEQMASAVRSDTITIPTPGELFAALSKPGKPNWTAQYREPIPTTYRSRAQIALNLGGLIADGFIAVEAQDSQQVKNIGTDIIKLAKALGVSENVLGRGKSINEFAEGNQWDALQEELEATQNEVKSSMQSNRDQDFIILVSLGGWVRGTQVVGGLLQKEYNEGSAKVLRQPALVSFMQDKVKAVSPELQEEPLVKAVSAQLPDIQKLVTFPDGGTPTAEDVGRLNAAVSKLMDEIESKVEAK
ncbi:MAG: hypothetical protein H0X73_05010 [Chthoniobacterales bacterium]|nr:hypothetical protein [Chthoniobacterales bacterium]